MSKIAGLYQNTRNVADGSNLNKLNDELQDVAEIPTKNMEELLWRGGSLDRKPISPSYLTLFGTSVSQTIGNLWGRFF